MATIFRQVWRDAEFGKLIAGTGFGLWSDPVIGEADCDYEAKLWDRIF